MVDENRRTIAHLLRRAGFGAGPAEIDSASAAGYEATVNTLLQPENFNRPDEDILDRFHSEHCDEESPRWVAIKWVFRMINSERPLEEKMALMWHGVFATGWAKVTNGQMMSRQYEMLRDHGIGDFRTLLEKLSRDPAMLYWLDQQTNHADAVNENYGRELLELFSMGRGNYNEEDVRSCARAFSGWTITHVLPRYPTGYWPSEFVFNADDHDDGEKTFLGETGNFDGDDIIEIIVRQRAAGVFVASEIYKFFVADEPDSEAIGQIADSYFANNYDLREVMRFVFNSDFFKQSMFKRVKSPIEFIVGTVRLTGQYKEASQFGLARLPKLSGMMGQEILNPPTVEGWHTGREWIDSAFLVERVNYATQELTNSDAPGITDMASRVNDGRTSISTSDLMDICASEFVHIDLDDDTKKVIADEISTSGDVACGGNEIVEAITEILALIGASKEYQMA